MVHARGAGAHGYFEAYGKVGDEPVNKYTRAKLFQEKGKITPMFARFSTVVHGGHSPETLRDPRGFAVKFYTEDGNWDLVGNNLKIFFIRDPIKFPDLVHAFKPDPVTNKQDVNRIFDFISLTPEATHMITWLFSPWGKNGLKIASCVISSSQTRSDGWWARKCALCDVQGLKKHRVMQIQSEDVVPLGEEGS